MVRRAHHLLVVLHDDDRVAEVAQPLERRDQLGVVALVQPDRGLVEDVEHANERGADLGRQADALRLAPRERRRRPVHRQVSDPDVLQEAQPLGDLAQDQPGDMAIGLGQLHLLEPLERPMRRQGAEVLDSRSRDEHRARLGAQAGAAAHRTGSQRHELLDLLPRPLRVGLPVAPLQVPDDPLEPGRVGPAPAIAVAVGDLDRLAVGAVEEQLALVLGQLFPRRVQIHAVAFGDRLRHLLVVVGGAVRPGRQGPFADRQRGVRHDQLGVDLHLRAQARAVLARAVWRVEREDPRLELDQRGAVLRAGEALGEREDGPRRRAPAPGRIWLGRRARALRAGRMRALAVSVVFPIPARSRRGRPIGGGRTAGAHYLDLHEAVGEANRRLDRVGEPLADVVAHHQPVDDHRDVVLVALVQHDRLLEHAHPVVYLHAREAVGAQLLQQLSVLALAAPHDGREHHEASALGELHHLVDDLLGGLPDDRPPADRAVGLADTRPQQAQVVVDLGDRTDGRSGVSRGGLLVDRDRRREPLDRVHVGLVHLSEELPGVRRQRLDIAPLALCIDRVECEA